MRSIRSTGRAQTFVYGESHDDFAPSGVVTFLFTDIEGSTRRWEADADAMRAALEAHDHVMRETVAAHSGWLFKHTGDGVCAAFASPRAAVDAAVDAQRTLELPVRMGIATGEAELREDDYFGASAQSCRAGDGGRPRRADPDRRRDRGAAQRDRPVALGTATAARYRETGHRVSGHGRTGCALNFHR